MDAATVANSQAVRIGEMAEVFRAIRKLSTGWKSGREGLLLLRINMLTEKVLQGVRGSELQCLIDGSVSESKELLSMERG